MEKKKRKPFKKKDFGIWEGNQLALLECDILRRLKELLKEEKSISSVVEEKRDEIVELIYNKSLQKIKNQQVKESPVENLLYVEGNLNTDINGTNLTVSFIMYLIPTYREYNQLYNHSQSNLFNCECDFDKGIIYITSALISTARQTPLEFEESIAHELTHYFQYTNGLQKRKDFYDDIVEMTNSNDSDVSIVGKCLYLTFSHEQDAFVHQFYTRLTNIEFEYDDFERLLYTQSYYGNFEKLYSMVNRIDKSKLFEILKNIGLSHKQFNNRLHFAKKRFYRKMSQAFKLAQHRMFERKNSHKLMMTESTSDYINQNHLGYAPIKVLESCYQTIEDFSYGESKSN